MIPTNEQETIALFAQLAPELGYTFKEVGTRCPDAILTTNGHEVRVEFEQKARNFQAHKHPVDAVDLIICWEDNWATCPLPVLSLENYITLAKPLPKWKRWLLKLKEVRLVIIEHRAEIKAARLKLRRSSYCKACGSIFHVSCTSSIQLDVDDREFTENYITKSCTGCNLKLVERYTEWV